MITLSPGVPVGIDPPESDRESLIASLDGVEVGFAVWRLQLGVASVDVVASLSEADHDVEILEALRAQAREQGATAMTVEVVERQDSLCKALQGAPVLSTFMVKPAPVTPPDLPDGFEARPMTAAEYERWKQLGVDEYAASNLARCGGNEELAMQRSLESFRRLLPDDADTVDTRLLTLTQDGDPVGDLWLRHHWPRYRDAAPADDQTFTFDVAVAADRRGEGLGRAAMLAAERFAVEVGDHQLGLNVFGDNDVATGLYRSLGYLPRSTVVDVAVR